MQITVKYYISHQEVMPAVCDLRISATMTTNSASHFVHRWGWIYL